MFQLTNYLKQNCTANQHLPQLDNNNIKCIQNKTCLGRESKESDGERTWRHYNCKVKGLSHKE